MHAIFRGKPYGAVTIGERGQLVIPAGLRKALNIKPGDQLMVFSKLDKKVINLIPLEELSALLGRAARAISKLKRKLPKSK